MGAIVPRTGPRYRHATRKEHVKIKLGTYKLDELFSDKAVADFMAVARLRVIGEFHYAVDYRGGRLESTDNYIIGVGGCVSDLARYVTDTMHRQIIKPDDLPDYLWSRQSSLDPRLIDRIIEQATFDVMSLVVNNMRHEELWYDEATGIWQIRQSSIDDFMSVRRRSKAATSSVKRDDRNYHGRNRSQSVNRGIPAGTSIGLS